MPVPVYKTRGEIRSAVLARIGMGGMGAAASNAVPWLNDLLDEAHEVFWELMNEKDKQTFWDIETVESQQWYDIPDTMDHKRISSAQVKYSGQWIPMTEGIDMHHDSNSDLGDEHYPQRYDIKYNNDGANDATMIEVYRIPDGVYTMRFEAIMRLSVFTGDADIPSVHHRLIIQYCTAYGKAHLKKPDAKEVMDALNILLKRMKGKQHKNNGVYKRGGGASAPEPRPKTV